MYPRDPHSPKGVVGYLGAFIRKCYYYSMKPHLLFALVAVSFSFSTSTVAHAEKFFGLSPSHKAYEAIADLSSRGIFTGYPDGTFRLNQPVSRAEMAAVLTRGFLPKEAYANIVSGSYQDIPKGIWYLPYVEALRRRTVVDGPPETTHFRGADTVRLAEFLKMLFLLDDQDVDRYRVEEISIAEDVDDPQMWFYPYAAHGVTATMITPEGDESLHPGKELTRAEVALYLHRYLLYTEGKHIERAQELIGTHLAGFFAEYSVYPDSDLAEQLAFRMRLLSDGLETVQPLSEKSQALKNLSQVSQHLFDGEGDKALKILSRVQNHSPQTYREYFLDLVHGKNIQF